MSSWIHAICVCTESSVLGDGKNYLILPVLGDEAWQVEALFGTNPWRALDTEFNLVPDAGWKDTQSQNINKNEMNNPKKF